ncbi:unnamed protein product [Tenebrio molitor]|nr:unnamed protein product [Tenebrio molitor]
MDFKECMICVEKNRNVQTYLRLSKKTKNTLEALKCWTGKRFR